MMENMDKVQEGEADCFAPTKQKITAKMDIFYNPLMKENRDITVLFLNAFFDKSFVAASIMAGTGIREVRLLKETPNLGFVAINDGNPKAVELIKKNLDSNSIPTEKYSISNTEASLFLLQNKSWDYIDVDPFGTPNPFLDAAIKKCKNNGVIGITATDTAALAGTYPKATLRKYWATPLRNYLMHEIGVRIFLRKIQLIAAHYEKAAIPVFSYSSQHYYRVFVKIIDSKTECDKIIKQHGEMYYCKNCMGLSKQKCSVHENSLYVGPLWFGLLWDKEIAQKIAKANKWKENELLLNTISEESSVNEIGFFDIHAFARSRHLSSLPKINEFVELIKSNGYETARTHFSLYGIRTKAPIKEIEKMFNQYICGHQ